MKLDGRNRRRELVRAIFGLLSCLKFIFTFFVANKSIHTVYKWYTDDKLKTNLIVSFEIWWK